jgi:aspartate oxidase
MVEDGNSDVIVIGAGAAGISAATAGRNQSFLMSKQFKNHAAFKSAECESFFCSARISTCSCLISSRKWL